MIRKRFQLGYTLIEIALVLTVSLMISSWLAVNYFQVEKVKRDNEAAAIIDNIEEAIVSYATSHSAKSYIWINGDATARVVRWRLPAGRPYLPCPDITGDGLEDRRPLKPVDVLEVYAVGSDLEGGGDCYSDRGMVPWRTLNVPDTDPWGNFHTYRVDDNFSNAVVGFDEETRADQGTYTRPLITRNVSGQSLAFRPVVVAVFTPLSHPSLTRPRPIMVYNDPSLICRSAPCTPTSPLIAGEVAEAQMTVQTGGYDAAKVQTNYEEDQIISGVPVVILSHGQNGHGAVRFNITALRSALRCNDIPAGHDDEVQNALFHGVCIAPAGANVGRQNGFVMRPRTDRSEGGVQAFDDIIGWMSTEEIAAAMRKRGTFPVDTLPPIGLERF